MASNSRILRTDAETALLVVLGGIAALALGFIASTGSIPAAAVVAGVVAGLILLISPGLMFYAVLIGALVVAGLAMLYVPQLQLVRWGVALASVALIGIALLQRLSLADRPPADDSSVLGRLLLALFVVTLLGAYASGQGPGAIVSGVKSYFQVAGVFVALTMIAWPQRFVDQLPKLILGVAFLQLPFAAHQYLVLAPRRMGYGEGVVPYDVVAGTFGATMFGGGANAVLSAFMLIVVAVLLGLWNNKAISTTRLVLFALPLMAPIFVNESKVSLLYILIVVGVIFKNEIMVRPMRAIMSGLALVGLLAGLLVAYAAYYADSAESTTDLITGTIEQNFSDDVGHGEFYLNRWSAMVFWSEEHGVREPVQLLLGHGTRATREGGSGLDDGGTLASQQYPGMGIGLTGASALLWETGLLGFAIVMAMFAVAFRMAGRLREFYQHDPWRSGTFSGLQAGVAILTLSLFHKSYITFDIGYQTIIMLLFGYLVYYSRLSEAAASAATPSD